LRLTVRGTEADKVERLLQTYLEKLEDELQGISYGYGDFVLEKEIGELLSVKGETLAVAESFTGGSVLSALTRIPGASRYLKGGIVSYSKETKIKELGISPGLIEQHSVVSAAVAEAMAVQIRKKMHTDYGIATTGNAGPGVDDTQRGVGDVYLAISTETGVYSVFRNLGQPREKVIARGTSILLEMLYKEIRKKHE
jgi:nicotinamide-nucleotide amidase